VEWMESLDHWREADDFILLAEVHWTNANDHAKHLSEDWLPDNAAPRQKLSPHKRSQTQNPRRHKFSNSKKLAISQPNRYTDCPLSRRSTIGVRKPLETIVPSRSVGSVQRPVYTSWP
jgi:hypothetical protein